MSDLFEDRIFFGWGLFTRTPYESECVRKLLSLMKTNNLEGLKKYVQKDLPTCSEAFEGYPIHLAIRMQKLEIFKILVEAPDFDVNIKNPQGRTPLMRICSFLNETPKIQQMFDFLIRHPGINVHIRDKRMTTALHYAAEAGNLRIVKKLFKMGADVNLENEDKKTPLEFALEGCTVQSPRLDLIQFLVSRGADVWHTHSKRRKCPHVMHSANKVPAVCKFILSIIPEAERSRYVNQGLPLPLLATAIKDGSHGVALALLEMGLMFEGFAHFDYHDVVESLCFVTERSQLETLVIEKLDIDALIEAYPKTIRMTLDPKCFKGCSQNNISITALFIFSKMSRRFCSKTFRVCPSANKGLDESRTVLAYPETTVIGELLSQDNISMTPKLDFLRFLVTRPGVELSESVTHEILPPLIAAGLTPQLCFSVQNMGSNWYRYTREPYEDSGYPNTGTKIELDEILDLLLEHKAWVRTRHCFSLLLSNEKFDFLMKTYFTKGIFCMDDLFEDDLTMLFQILSRNYEAFLTAEKLRPIDHKPLSHLDNDLDDLLVQRLRHSQIRISKLRELQAGFSVQDYPRTKATVEMALKDFKVMPLTTLARLSLKSHFNFLEKDINKYLEDKDLPWELRIYVTKGVPLKASLPTMHLELSFSGDPQFINYGEGRCFLRNPF